MLKIENVIVPNGEQWMAVIQGARNPMNSWGKMDSHVMPNGEIRIGENDLDLLMRLRKAGPEHCKYLRKIVVYLDITAPLYWWKELDTYKIGTVCDSCSTMHKIHSKEFTLDDFSHEHLQAPMLDILEQTIKSLNDARDAFLSSNDKLMWWQMIQLLPSSYNQKRSIMLNYKVLADMYQQRKNHKLDEWHTFCDWIESLPYSELILGEYL